MTNTVTVNETSSGRYIGVQFFLVRKAEKVIVDTALKGLKKCVESGATSAA